MAPEKDDLCKLHSGHEAILRDHERRLKQYHDDQVDIWNAIKDKVSNKFFIILVGFVVGGLGFQLMIYDTIKAVDKKVAVIEAVINAKAETRGIESCRNTLKGN